MNQSQEKPFMSVWAVYYNPNDFPGKYVARRHDIFREYPEPMASDQHYVADSLVELRDLIPPGLCCLPPAGEDDFKIVETWV